MKKASPLFVVLLLLASALAAQQRSPCFLTVVGPHGKPVEGAEVTCVFTPDRTAVGEPDVVTATSDERGRVQCHVVVGRPYSAWAIGPADENGARWVGEPVVLVAAGRVLDVELFERRGPGTRKLEGLAAWREVGGVGLRWYPVAAQPAFFVDLPMPDGDEFVLPPSPSCTGLLGVWREGPEVDVMVVAEVDRDADQPVALPPPVAVRVHVLAGAGGEPLSQARVVHDFGYFSQHDRGVFDADGAIPLQRTVATTDARGAAEFHVPDPGSRPVVLQVGKPGHLWQHASLGDERELTFELPRCAEREVKVIGIDEPLDLTLHGGWFVRIGKGVMHGNRRYHVSASGPNRWRTDLHENSFATLATVDGIPGAMVVGKALDPDAPKIDASSLVEHEVHVVAANGDPTPAVVGIVNGSVGTPLRWLAVRATDVGGRVRLWLPREEFLIYVSTGDAHAYQAIDGPTDGPMRLALEPLPTMRVRVLADGKPVRGAKAMIEGMQFRGSTPATFLSLVLSPRYVRFAISGVDGELEVLVFDLPNARCELVVRDARRRSEPFQWQAGGQIDVTIDG